MKRKHALLTAILSVMLLLMLSACGTASEDPIVGTWEMTEVSALGQKMTAEEFLESMEAGSEIPQITFKDNYTVKAEMIGSQGTGEWERDDDAYLVTDDTSASLTFKLKDDTLRVEQGGATLKFERKETE